MSIEGVARKKRIHAGHRASATKTITQIDCILLEDSPDMAKLLQLKLSVQEKLETIKILGGELLDLVEESELATEIEQADGFKESIYTAIIKIDKCTAMAHARTSVDTAEPRPLPVARDRVKLPKLLLRPFNGNMTNWTTFWGII